MGCVCLQNISVYTIYVCIHIFHIYMKYKKVALRVSNAKSADTKHRT